ncbi:MAG: hypothetical protein K0M55_19490 [Rhizobium sp.]|nr:hypothetical protein [Rhizobium sp.]
MTHMFIPVKIPLDDIAAALGPLVLKAIRTTEREEDEGPRHKPQSAALLDAASNVSAALSTYENSMGTRDERRALNKLIASSKGPRDAVATIKNS